MHGTCACLYSSLPLSLNGPKVSEIRLWRKRGIKEERVSWVGWLGETHLLGAFKEIKDAAPYAQMPPFSDPFSGVGSV